MWLYSILRSQGFAAVSVGQPGQGWLAQGHKKLCGLARKLHQDLLGQDLPPATNTFSSPDYTSPLLLQHDFWSCLLTRCVGKQMETTKEDVKAVGGL